jgi:spore germination protein (amino acid permease)
MSNQKATKLADSLIISNITHTIIGGGYLFLSVVTAKHLSHNTYMGLLLGLLFFLPFAYILADLARLFPHQSFTNIFRRVLGKYCGLFLSLLFIFHAILISALGLKQSQLMVSSYFLPRTPLFLVNIVFIAMVLYLAWHGIKAISRLAAFMLIPPLIGIFILQLLELFNVNWLNLRPILSGTPIQWLAAGFDSLYLLIPAYVGMFYLPFLKNPKQMLKILLIPVSITFPLLFLATISMVGTFGPALITKIAWPTMETFHVIDMPLLLLEQADLFFLITWYAFIFVTATLGVYLTSNELNFLWPKVKLKWLLITVGAIYLIIASLPLNITFIAGLTGRFYWLFITMHYLPFLITWVVARVRLNSKS